ncbi:LytR/AlgR family response regulator transcription factor [Aequorivita viscosa]|uniref:Two component transcriptional regulator, LytTR family n=1 Tax=Aequorivita viscosa TaxID=797419 RepID=A0A1M6MXW1_9FLAO|nr:LytTR family DNA-binding domain-containing protein [Aequorivita viscosa]SDX39125.1 two component transcriptional regulator, LytTR family [Aequorivita viscosa]SHJ88288.1 two component transcriptional regulator, LytTR family [Aequorivita viscosa]
MIRILIIEDEIPARKKLKRFIGALDTPTEIVAEIDTVDVAVEFLNNNQVDLIFSDIELLDGSAFEIYRLVSVSCPIIYTTAYDKFWMDAFDSNGIAYLLKPFSKERFEKAWDKFLLFRNPANSEKKWISNIENLLKQNIVTKTYKKRFTINTHQGFYFLETETILYFSANEGVVFAYDFTNKKHLLSESTLKEIEAHVDPTLFFRINRSELVNKLHIDKIERYSKNVLALKFKGHDGYLKTSQSNTSAFREWIEK